MTKHILRVPEQPILLFFVKPRPVPSSWPLSPSVDYVVKEHAESSLHCARATPGLLGIRIYYNAYALVHHGYVDIGTSHDRIAVNMHKSRLLPAHMYALCLECLYVRVLVERFVEHIDTKLRGLHNAKWFHDDYVKQTVAHRRACGAM